jgi:hypothetical protein
MDPSFANILKGHVAIWLTRCGYKMVIAKRRGPDVTAVLSVVYSDLDILLLTHEGSGTPLIHNVCAPKGLYYIYDRNIHVKGVERPGYVVYR